MASEVPPQRPRRERPLVAAGRERRPEPFVLDLSALPPPLPRDGPPVDPSQRVDHVWVSFTGPMPQKRVTVVFRFVLAVPHVLWMGLLGIAWEAVAFVAWFAALFTGRVPDGMARFLAQVVQYQARVTAYGALLMTDEFPPFDLEAPDYAVNMYVSPARLNRLAVLLRFVLMVPSSVLATLLFLGAQIASSVTWLLTLVVGRTPTPLWEANAAVLRYQTRAAAFASLLTAEQPGGVLGDRVEAAPLAAESGVPRLSLPPRIFRLASSRAGRRLVVVFGVIALVFYASVGVIFAVAAGRVANAQAELEDAHARLEVSLTTFASDEAQCPPESLPSCLRDATERLADEFDRFAEDVRDIEFGEFVNASVLVAGADECASALRRMSAAPNSGEFQVAYFDYRNAFGAFDEDYRAVTFDVQSYE